MDLNRMSLSWVECHLLIMQQSTLYSKELFYRSIIIFVCFALFSSLPRARLLFIYMCNLEDVCIMKFH